MSNMTNPRVTVNKEVSVTALYFHNNGNFKSFPKRIEFEGREVTFMESGLRFLIQKGQRLTQIFDMTDGNTDYRLKFDDQDKLWTLIDIAERPRAFA